jgi:UDP-N-acetylmuramoyl-tripeptide--D-alanyl-D-alanine ligase
MFLPEENPQFRAVQARYLESDGVTTDTRTAGPGQLFFALKGDQFNGNTYAGRALEAGCIAAVVDEPAVAATGDDRFILVPDALAALQSLARWHRRTWSCPVIGLTGSNGKTTTKELVKCVLETNHTHVHATHGNFNNHIGVPLTILAAKSEPDVAIIEMGANAQQEIALLAEIAEPNIAVITNIGRAHLEGFGGEEGVLKGKGELFDFIRNHQPESPVFVHGAHPKLIAISEGLHRRLYGTEGHAPFVHEVLSEQAFSWQGPSGEVHGPIHVQVQGDHNRENIMTAIAIGLHCGADEVQASNAVAQYTPTNNRSQWTQTPHNRVLLDAYNANPSSMRAALSSFHRLTTETGKASVCILGDMAELGDHTEAAHLEILEFAHGLHLKTYAVGPHFQHAASTRADIQSFGSTAEAIAHFKGASLEGYDILLKGSRSIALEALLPVL